MNGLAKNVKWLRYLVIFYISRFHRSLQGIASPTSLKHVPIILLQESLSRIMEVPEAEAAASDNLSYANNHGSQEPLQEGVALLYEAIGRNDWNAVRGIIEVHPNALEVRSSTGQTALHVAAQLGHLAVLEGLVRLVPSEDLEVVDDNGYTPLALAALYSDISAAECLVAKNERPLGIPTLEMLLPVTLAFTYHRRDMGWYLFAVTPLEFLDGPRGSRLLDTCCIGGYFDIVLYLLATRQELLSSDELRSSLIMAIANVPDAFPSGRQLVFWRQWIYHSSVFEEISRVIYQAIFFEDISSDFYQGLVLLRRLGLVKWLILHSCSLLGIGLKEIYELKMRHAQANRTLRIICDKLKYLNEEQKKNVGAALFRAAEEGIVEIVLQVSKANPQLILLKSPETNWHAFFFAVQNRQAEVFNLIHGFRFKNLITASVDRSGNSMLHVAAILAPFSQLHRISGAALQMQREFQWYKAVESVVPPELRVRPNKKHMKPIDFFKVSHKKLRDEGEKWMMDTTTSCSVVGALLVTIVYAAAFTVPGRNDQNSGYPIFLDKEKLFMLFVVSDVLLLFSSTTSVLTF